ncbi:MAG: PAS domain-containing protein, partial [Desulfobacula sp.]|nr:PAS domain-containing protein [Desulfobacula sp.]
LIQEDVIVIDLKYRILDINDAMLKNLGLERDAVIGKTCYEITHHQNVPCSGKKHPCPLDHIISLKKPFKTTHVHLGKDKNEIVYSISGYPLFDNGKVIGAVEISQDITKEINIRKVMMQQEKLASIGRLAAGVAHEINNPMTTILTSAILTQEDMDADDPNYQELQTIVDETLRCRKIVTSLLDFSRQTKPAIKNNDINNIVNECAVLTRKQAAFNDVLMKLSLADNLPLIRVDKDQIQQALINLSLNAIEATGPGGSVTFATRFLSEPGMVEILVNDTGCGISNKNLDNIFDPFFTTKKNGTGLGLAITHGIIEQHGGIITVNSKPEQGTHFSIKLPLATGDENVI